MRERLSGVGGRKRVGQANMRERVRKRERKREREKVISQYTINQLFSFPAEVGVAGRNSSWIGKI